MNLEKLVTIVIPTRKIDALLSICLSEISKLYPLVRVIVVADYIVENKLSSVEQVKSKSHNLSIKRNQGVDLASTEYIAFIDSDAYPQKGWLEAAISFLGTSKAGLVGGPNLKHELCADDQTIPYLASKSFLVSREPEFQENALPVKTIASSNMIFKRSVYNEISGMNVKIFTGEDIDLSYRVGKKYQNYFLFDSKVHHRHRQLKGFIKQRFIWGRGIFNVLRFTFPDYLISLCPFLFLVCLIFTIYIQSYFIALMYIFLCMIESVRLGGMNNKSFNLFFYIFLSQIVMGLGAVYSLFRGDIKNNYTNYRNDE